MQEQIDHIIATHKDKIYKTCLGFTADQTTAKDLVQEVLINIWSGLKNFRKDANISTWIYRITVNTCLMHQRKKKVHLMSLSTMTKEIPAHDVDKNLDEEIVLLRRFLSELPEKDRLIMILYLEKLSYEEIASILGLTKSNIGVRINRIKKILQTKFKQHGR